MFSDINYPQIYLTSARLHYLIILVFVRYIFTLPVKVLKICYNDFMKIHLIKNKYFLATFFILLSLIIVALTSYTIYIKLKNSDKIETNSETTTNQFESPVAETSYMLSIDKIGVNVPIIINVDGNNKDEYNKSLENGVAHLKGVALPGKYGNTFIFGHSSYYAWKPGNYKEIFKDLNKLNIGDEIIINSNLYKYTYQVSDKQIVSPDRVDVADQNYTEKKLTLMTCWPIGSDAKRLIVVAMLKETTAVQ